MSMLVRVCLVVRASIAQVDGEVWEKGTKLHQRCHIALDNVTIAVLKAHYQQRQQRVGATLTWIVGLRHE
jgi:integrase